MDDFDGSRAPIDSKGIEEQLRQAIETSRLSRSELAALAKVDKGQISRFMSRERSLKLSTASDLAAALGLELRPVKRSHRNK
jgi:transcriptional regulator with XRE-family HTH domain